MNVMMFGKLVAFVAGYKPEKEASAVRNAEMLSDRLFALVGDLVPPPVGLPIPYTVEPYLVKQLLAAVSDNKKIDAIKAVRTMTGIGLKEAKDLVEAHYTDWQPALGSLGSVSNPYPHTY